MSVYRAEVVGSMLRPGQLKDARLAWQQGTLATPEFKRIEDRAVDAAIAQQEAVGLDVISDGELRRGTFLGPLLDTYGAPGNNGDDRSATSLADTVRTRAAQHAPGFAITGTSPAAGCRRIHGPRAGRRGHHAAEPAHAAAEIRQHTPIRLSSWWMLSISSVEEVHDVAALGCTYIQIDAPTSSTSSTPPTPARIEAQGVDRAHARRRH